MKDLSIYIHIPFCKTICLYCNFLTFAHKNKKIPAYVEALKREIAEKSRAYRNYRIETIYFGGGTPSLIASAHIGNILETIRKNFNVADTAEISIECNPESLDAPKLKDYTETGVNRISLGIQTFDKKTLWRLARPHDSETIFKALSAIQKSGFRNFGADFIIGLPDQTPDQFHREMQTILEYQPPHLSFYFLSYDTKKIDLFKADCPTEEKQIEMYEYVTATLAAAGYTHYEVSNYAKPGFECRHNLRYWNQREYLGLGLGAHSYINHICTENGKDFETYISDPMKIHEKVPIDPELQKMDYIMLRIRTHKGIDLTDFRKKFGGKKELIEKAGPYLGQYMTIQGKNLMPTEEGYLIIDRITRDLL